MGIEGWGRNFADELTANITFDKTNNNGATRPPTRLPSSDNIIGGGDNNDATLENGDTPTEGEPSKDELKQDDDGIVENPYTSDKGLIIVLGIVTCTTGVVIIIVSKNKFAKYTVLILMLSPVFTLTYAEETIELPIKVNVSFESQNVMSKVRKEEEVCEDWNADGEYDGCWNDVTYLYFWEYRSNIKNIYIENKINEIVNYAYSFDVTEEQNGRVMAYLISKGISCVLDDWNEKICVETYDLYLQADGVIYPNKNSSYYFAYMKNLESIDNLEGLDTSEVTDMSYMFYDTGSNITNFTLDLSNFDTSNVINMSYMFEGTGSNSENFTLDLSSFDTSNVENMSEMFYGTGYSSAHLVLDLSSFDTSNVRDMSYMFYSAGRNSEIFALDVSGFNTSNVTNMSGMFGCTGSNSTNFTLDVSNFDTSNVINMSHMFEETGYNNPNFTLDLSNFDTSNVIDMNTMFSRTGFNSVSFTLDLGNFDTSKVTDMRYMFQETGFNSTSLKISITIRSPYLVERTECDRWECWTMRPIDGMFNDAALGDGSQITVNYTSETEEIVNNMIATKPEGSNVVKGILVD